MRAMFLPARMLRLTVIALERDKRALLEGLGQLGVVQLTLTALAGAKGDQSIEEQLARCASLLGRISELRRSLEIAPVTGLSVEAAEDTPEHDEQALGLIEKRTRQWVDSRKLLEEKLRQLEVDSNRLSDFCAMGVPLDRLQQSPFLHFVTASIPAEKLRIAQERLAGQMVVLPMAPGKVLAIGTRHAGWEQELRQLGFRFAETFPPTTQSTEELAAAKRQEAQRTSEEMTRLDADVESLKREADPLLSRIERRTRFEQHLLSAEQTLGWTTSTVVLTGWTPAMKAELLQVRVREITKGRCFIDYVTPGGTLEEEIPIQLQPSMLLKPFQRLVAFFGLPNYQEIEPSLFLAITYLVMFGMMSGDAGQGLVLAVGGAVLLFGRWLAPRRLRPVAREAKDVGAVLLWAGFSSAVFGVLYGSYFGIPQLKQFAVWRDPLEGNPARLLLISIAFGVGTISLGLILNVVNRLRYRDFRGGLFGHSGLLGILFYWGAVLLTVRAAAVGGGKILWMAGVLALPIAGWMIKEIMDSRSGGNGVAKQWPLAIPAALVSAFEAVLIYFANTVSFVRLAAYAMSHAALLVATFAIAVQTSRVPHVGTALSVGVVVVGNLVAIGLEGVIAAVQGLRLEFYEFFSKFFSAEGKPFKPFRLTESADFGA